jgi:hypothetical protein
MDQMHPFSTVADDAILDPSAMGGSGHLVAATDATVHSLTNRSVYAR